MLASIWQHFLSICDGSKRSRNVKCFLQSSYCRAVELCQQTAIKLRVRVQKMPKIWEVLLTKLNYGCVQLYSAAADVCRFVQTSSCWSKTGSDSESRQGWIFYQTDLLLSVHPVWTLCTNFTILAIKSVFWSGHSFVGLTETDQLVTYICAGE